METNNEKDKEKDKETKPKTTKTEKQLKKLLKNIDIEKLNKFLQEKTEPEAEKNSAEIDEISAKDILSKAQKLDAEFTSMNKEEKKYFVENLKTSNPAMHKLLFDKGDAFAYKLNDDLTFAATTSKMSDIIPNLPVWYITAKIIDYIKGEYPLVDLINKEMGANGNTTLLYKMFGTTDGLSGTEDVKIGDYNSPSAKVYYEKYFANLKVHSTYSILDSILNDAVPTAGLFIALINDYTYNIARPIAKWYYSNAISLLNGRSSQTSSSTTGIYDKEITIPTTATTTNDKIKFLYNKLQEFATINTSNLSAEFGPKKDKLEHRLNLKESVIVWNSNFATDYGFDLKANAFNVGEVKIEFGDSKVFNFEMIDNFDANNRSALKNFKCFIIEKNALNEIMHYTASKNIDTPKLKRVFHTYIKTGFFKRKDKMFIAVK